MGDKDISVIPKGYYCYDDKGICPYWSLIPLLPGQENGRCAFLEKSDWDLNEEKGKEVELFGKDVKLIGTESAHILKCSLLWDKVKECGLKKGG